MNRCYVFSVRFAFFVFGLPLLLGATPPVVVCAAPPPPVAPKPILRIEAGGHTAQARAVAFTPDGAHLVSAGFDKAVRVWNVENGEQERVLRYAAGAGVDGQAFALAVSRDSIFAVGLGGAAAADIVLFNGATGAQIGRLRGHRIAVTGLAFSPDGKSLFSCGGDGTVRRWDIAARKAVWEKTVSVEVDRGRQGSYLYALAVSPNGARVAAAADDGFALVFEAASGKETGRASLQTSVRAVALTNETLALGGADGALALYNLATRQTEALPRQADSVNTLAFSPDGKSLLSGGGERGNSSVVRVWDVAARAPLGEMRPHETTVFSIAAAPDGRRVASADAYGALHLWDKDNPQGERILRSSSDAAFRVAWSPDGRRAGWSTHSGGALTRVFDVYNVAPAPAPPPAAAGGWLYGQTERAGLRLSLDADGREVLVRNAGGTVKARIRAEKGDLFKCAAWTTGGGVIVGSDLYLSEWELGGGGARKRRLLEGHSGSVLSVSVSPDGKYLLSGSSDQSVRVWNLLQTGTLAPLLNLFQDDRESWIAWTEAGYFAASANGDERIGWQVDKGPDAPSLFYPARSFWQVFWRPDIVMRVVPASDVAQAVREADAVRPPAQKTDAGKTSATLAQFAPPNVSIVDPPDGQKVTGESINVRVRVSDPNQLSLNKIFIRANGVGGVREIPPFPGIPGEPVELTLAVRLQPGENKICVVAENNARTESVLQTVRVVYGIENPPKPRLLLLSVGVDHPLNMTDTLNYAAKDATDFRQAYLSQKGPFFESVLYDEILTNKDATLAALQKKFDEIKEISKQGVRPSDYLIVFLAGHGNAVAPRVVAPNVADYRYCFLTYDAQPDKLAGTSQIGEDLLKALEGVQCNVVLIMDTCRKGSQLLRADDPNVALSYLNGNIRYSRIMIQSCGPTESSGEDPKSGHGFFTQAFLSGISGKITPASPPLISLQDLEGYLTKEVSALTQKAQNPRVDIPFYIPLNKTLFPVASLPPNAAAPLQAAPLSLGGPGKK